MAVGGDGSRTTSGAFLDPIRSFELQFTLLGDDGALFTSYRRIIDTSDPAPLLS